MYYLALPVSLEVESLCLLLLLCARDCRRQRFREGGCIKEGGVETYGLFPNHYDKNDTLSDIQVSVTRQAEHRCHAILDQICQFCPIRNRTGLARLLFFDRTGGKQTFPDLPAR